MKYPLQVKHITNTFDPAEAGNAIVVPFQIGVGDKQALCLKKLVVFQSQVSDTELRIDWRLIAKSEVAQEASSGPNSLSNSADAAVQDNDLLAFGNMQFMTGAGGEGDKTVAMPYQIEFPHPGFIIPRSPSMVFRWSADTIWTVYASLYYEKRVMKSAEIITLMKMWKGRKQDVVSNVPRTIDE